MPIYRIFDISLDCDMPLPELPEGSGNSPVIRASVGSTGQHPGRDVDWFHEWQDADETVNLVCGRMEEDYVLRFPGHADFIISSAGDQVVYFPSRDTPVETLRHQLLDQVLPRILGHRGCMVLHASAVSVGENPAMVFVGETGRGKSTLASFYYRQGARIITDDCLLVETSSDPVYCIPNYRGLRLFDDSADALFGEHTDFEEVSHYSSKKRLILHDNNDEPRPERIGNIILLENHTGNNDDGAQITRIKGASEMIDIISQLFLLDVTDKNVIARQFNNVRDLVQKITGLYKLSYPHRYDELKSVQAIIDETIGQAEMHT